MTLTRLRQAPWLWTALSSAGLSVFIVAGRFSGTLERM